MSAKFHCWHSASAAPLPVAWLALTVPLVSQTYLPAIPGADDTERIEQALDACHSPQTRCRVQLGPGVFEVGFIVVENFHGTFVGAGIGNTIIKAKPDLEAHFIYPDPVSKTNRYPQLLTFLGGDFTIRDLSIRAEEYQPVKAYRFAPDWPDSYFLNGLLTIAPKAGSPAPNVRLERIEVSGADGDAGAFFGYNLPEGFGVNTNNAVFFGAFFFTPPMLGGRLILKDSVIKRAASAFGLLKTDGTEAELSGNRIAESLIGVDLDVVSASEFRLFDNHVNAWATGINIYQTPNFDPEGWGPSKPSRFFIASNAVHVTERADVAGAGISLKDDYTSIPGEKPRLDAITANNVIRSSVAAAGIPGYGIWLQATDGTRVVSNDVKGEGIAAIAADGARDCKLLSNGMEKFRASKAQLWFSSASSNCIAVGVPPSISVLDKGKDNKVTPRWWWGR